MTMNATHDPERQSWVASANRGAFPIQNLPFGIFREPSPRWALPSETRFWTFAAAPVGLLASLPAATAEACAGDTLNPLMALGPEHWSALRARLSDLLRADHPHAADHQRALAPLLVAMADATMLRPARIGNYTDFYASIDHATNVGGFSGRRTPSCPITNMCLSAITAGHPRSASAAHR